MIGALFKTATGFLGGIQTYLIVGAVTAAVSFAGGFYLEHRLAASTIAGMKLADANAQVDAVTLARAADQAQAKVALDAAVAEAAAQAIVVTRTNTITKEIPVYVTPHQDALVCVPVGLVRVLDAAVLQTDPAAIRLAPGESDDACSDVKASALGEAVVAWLGTSHANAEQLNALIAWIQANHLATSPENLK